MERLTERHYHANDYYMTCSENCNADMDCIDCPAFEKLVDRLGAYEDTGLTPDEVPTAIEMAQIYSIIEENKRYRALKVTVDRMKELAEADREGRVVVLPCKAGDTVYFAAWFGTQPHVVKRVIEPYFYTVDARNERDTADFSLRDFGKAVFLTREEAEEALRRDKNGNQ